MPAERPLLPAGLRGGAVALVVIAITVVVVLALRYSGDDAPGRLDGHLGRAVDDALPDTGHGVAQAVTLFGSPEIVAVAAVAVALVCLLARRPWAAVFAVAGPGLTGVITTLAKPVVDRTIGGYQGGLAFPSGHTGGATSLALVVALLAAAALQLGPPATALLAAVCAVLAGGAVGTGMVLLGSHYPTDVVGGFCTAVASVLALALTLDRVLARRARVRV